MAWVFLAFATVVLFGLVNFGLGFHEWLKLTREIESRKVDSDALKAEMAALDGQLKMLTSGRTSNVSNASAELLEILNRRPIWVDLFREMSVRVPEGVWLLRAEVVAVDVSKGRGKTKVAPVRTVVLEGFARSHEGVGSLLGELDRSSKFSAIQLKYSTKRPGTTGEDVSFQIQGQLS